MEESYDGYVGIDWGSDAHAIVLVDPSGQVHGTWAVAHTPLAVHTCLTAILAQTGVPPGRLAVGLEIPRGVLVDAVIERGFAVFALNPKQLDRFRDRYTLAGAKDDRRDAHVIADALRTDRLHFRRIRPDAPLLLAVREYAHILDELEREHRRLANQLRAQLARVAPQWLTLASGADQPWWWDLVEAVMAPTGPRRIGAARVTRILRRHRITRWTTPEVLTVLRHGSWDPAVGTWPAVQAHVALLLPRLRLVRSQRADSRAKLDRVLAECADLALDGEPGEHRDVSILRSLPGVGRKVTAAMLGYAARALADRDYPTLRSYAGVAPITRRSGKSYHVTKMRYACHAKLRGALHHWAGTSLRLDPAARAYYDTLRRRGCTHPRALRSVGDRWLRILMAMLKSQRPYDASRFNVGLNA